MDHADKVGEAIRSEGGKACVEALRLTRLKEESVDKTVLVDLVNDEGVRQIQYYSVQE